MAIINQRALAQQSVMAVATDMCNAARTAPKANGVDRLHIAVVEGEELHKLAARMIQMHAEGRGGAHFVRDADNVSASQACVLIATEIGPRPMGCESCTIADCANQKGYQGSPCVYGVHDLGLAVGSAASLAADRRVDNRVMYSVGAAVIDMGWFPKGVRLCMGIPLSVTGKSIFYDRKPLA